MFFAKNLSGSCDGFRRKTKRNTCRQCQNLRGLNFVVIYIYIYGLPGVSHLYIYTLGVAKRKTEQSYIFLIDTSKINMEPENYPLQKGFWMALFLIFKFHVCIQT